LHTNLRYFLYRYFPENGIGEGGVILYLGKYGRGPKKIGSIETLYVIFA
jgi:hypothetical protein